MDKLYGPLVINLDKRTDRLAETKVEMDRLQVKSWIRISASEGKDSALGCLDSHCRCLEDFLQTNEDSVMICEDDPEFKCTRQELDKHINEFLADDHAQVACLGFNSEIQEPYAAATANPSLFVRARDIQTRVCYIVKRSIATELNALWRYVYKMRISGADKNSRNWFTNTYKALPISNKVDDMYRGDQSWKILQQDHVFLIPKKRLVIQRPSYSDIEKRNVNYKV